MAKEKTETVKALPLLTFKRGEICDCYSALRDIIKNEKTEFDLAINVRIAYNMKQMLSTVDDYDLTNNQKIRAVVGPIEKEKEDLTKRMQDGMAKIPEAQRRSDTEIMMAVHASSQQRTELARAELFEMQRAMLVEQVTLDRPLKPLKKIDLFGNDKNKNKHINSEQLMRLHIIMPDLFEDEEREAA